MKKSLRIISALMAIMLVFTGCSKSGKTDKKTEEIKSEKIGGFSLNVKEKFTEKGEKIISYFGEKHSYEAILKDVSEINPALKPDFNNSKYTVKKVDDKESSKDIVQYYNGNKLIYEEFWDIGEAGFVNYTKTKRGAAAKVYYYCDEIGKAYNVVIKTDAYTVNIDMQNIAENKKLQTVTITAEKKSADKLSETIMYSACDGFIIVEKAMYYGKDGYIDYSCWIDINNELQENTDVKFAELDSFTDEDTFKKITDNTDISIIQTLMGCHELAYKGDKWFITTDLYVLFADEAEAKKYAKQNGISKESISNKYVSDGKAFYVLYKDITLPISDEFQLNGEGDFNELAATEFNDLTFADITVDSDNEITAINYNNSLLSCY